MRGRCASNLDEALVAIVRHRGADPDDGRSLETTANFVDGNCLGYSTKAEDPLTGDFLALFERVLIEVHDRMDARRNSPTDKLNEPSRAGGIERASYASASTLLEANTLTSSIFFDEIHARRLRCDACA